MSWFSKSAEEKFEDLVRKAAKDPGRRPDFFREFLNADLYFIGQTIGGFVGEQEVLRSGDNIEFRYTEMNGKVFLCVFTSPKLLQASMREEVRYLRMNAKEMLGMLRENAWLVMNPDSDCGKEFTPEEIRGLLDGSFLQKLQRFRIQSLTAVMVGQPAKPPVKLVEALKSYFSENQYAGKAYLGIYGVPTADEGPRCVIGIQMNRRSGQTLDSIIFALGLIARDTLEPGQSIDFIDVDEGGEIASYLAKETQPFFAIAVS